MMADLFGNPRADSIALLRELAARDGQALNATAIGRRLGVSNHTVRHRIDLLEKAGTIRILPSLGNHRPQVLLRHSSLLRADLTERIAAALDAAAIPIRLFYWISVSG